MQAAPHPTAPSAAAVDLGAQCHEAVACTAAQFDAVARELHVAREQAAACPQAAQALEAVIGKLQTAHAESERAAGSIKAAAAALHAPPPPPHFHLAAADDGEELEGDGGGATIRAEGDGEWEQREDDVAPEKLAYRDAMADLEAVENARAARRRATARSLQQSTRNETPQEAGGTAPGAPGAPAVEQATPMQMAPATPEAVDVDIP